MKNVNNVLNEHYAYNRNVLQSKMCINHHLKSKPIDCRLIRILCYFSAERHFDSTMFSVHIWAVWSDTSTGEKFTEKESTTGSDINHSACRFRCMYINAIPCSCNKGQISLAVYITRRVVFVACIFTQNHVHAIKDKSHWPYIFDALDFFSCKDLRCQDMPCMNTIQKMLLKRQLPPFRYFLCFDNQKIAAFKTTAVTVVKHERDFAESDMQCDSM